MKKELLLSILILLIVTVSYSQNWEWSKKTNFRNTYPYYPLGLFTDAVGKVYAYNSLYMGYGYSSSTLATDTTGTTLMVYDAGGNFLFKKRWAMPFYISRMSYDGASSIYFSAGFYGSLNIDGHLISSEGDMDGAAGKMDLNGNIIWINTFGGSGPDRCMGACFNPQDHSLYVCGSVKNTVAFNHVPAATGQQSGIICTYDANGNLMQYKLYDYVPERDAWDMNCGLEIACNGNGDLYVYMERDGKHWNIYNDTVAAPEMGNYVTKITATLDTIWSKFIIGPACYYGYSSNSLRVTANGDAYISATCDAKYGNSTNIYRLSAATGQITWNYPDPDGRYVDIYADNNKIYVVGVEGANGCPCPGSSPGYNIIKIFDNSNALLGETRFSGYFTAIAKSTDGGIYVTGGFHKRSCTMGPDVLVADSTLGYGGGYYNYDGAFLSRLGDLNCVAPAVTADVGTVYGQYYSLCPGEVATLSSNCSSGTFQWSNGCTNAQSPVTASGTYSLVNTQPDGCVAYSLPVSVIVNPNEKSHKIGIAGFDTLTGKNRIMVTIDDWEESSDVSNFYLYKEVAGTTTLIESRTGYQGYSFSFIDSTTSPAAASVTYSIKTSDSCGTLSPYAASHTTMLLNAAKGTDGKTYLSWNAYSGIEVSKYYIMRGNSPNSMVRYDSVSKLSTSYVDTDTAGIYYQVEARTEHGFYFAPAYSAGYMVKSSFSNPASTVATGILAYHQPPVSHSLDVYPNPAQNSFTVSCHADRSCMLSVAVRNALGELVYAETFKDFSGEFRKTIDLTLQPKGLYLLEAGFENERSSKTVVLQ